MRIYVDRSRFIGHDMTGVVTLGATLGEISREPVCWLNIH